MIFFFLLVSSICLIIAGNISQYDQIVIDGYCQIYSLTLYKVIMAIAKYLSILPVFILLYELDYGEMAWYFKMLIWVVFYLFVKVFGTWLFYIIFGFGKGGAATSIVVLIIGIVTLIASSI